MPMILRRSQLNLSKYPGPHRFASDLGVEPSVFRQAKRDHIDLPRV
jgi:hypothetical protein